MGAYSRLSADFLKMVNKHLEKIEEDVTSLQYTIKKLEEGLLHSIKKSNIMAD